MAWCQFCAASAEFCCKKESQLATVTPNGKRF